MYQTNQKEKKINGTIHSVTDDHGDYNLKISSKRSKLSRNMKKFIIILRGYVTQVNKVSRL